MLATEVKAVRDVHITEWSSKGWGGGALPPNIECMTLFRSLLSDISFLVT